MRIYTRTKKGSLSLSVNAIVVLVLAITMLGLGIAFTRNMFGSLEGRLLDNVDFQNIPEPTNSNPVSFENTRINVNSGSLSAIGFKALNTLTVQADLHVYSPNCVVTNQDDESLISNINFELDNEDSLIFSKVQAGEVLDYALIIDTRNTMVYDGQNSVPFSNINLCEVLFVFEESSDSDPQKATKRMTLQIMVQ